MMNSTQSQTIQTVPTQLPQIPDMTQLPLDPHNPLIWILVFSSLITATAKPLNAIANLLRAIALFLKSRRNDSK
jgi:hypothetical protein